jgi:hypothetical protein
MKCELGRRDLIKGVGAGSMAISLSTWLPRREGRGNHSVCKKALVYV